MDWVMKGLIGQCRHPQFFFARTAPASGSKKYPHWRVSNPERTHCRLYAYDRVQGNKSRLLDRGYM